MQINTTKKCHLTLIEMANSKKKKKRWKIENNKFDENGEKLEPVCSAGESIKWCNH